jgi:hypothetical protein
MDHFFLKKLSQQSVSHNLTMSQHILPEIIPDDVKNLAGCHHQQAGSISRVSSIG